MRTIILHRKGHTLNEFRALPYTDTPITDVLMHFHRCEQEVLIYVEIYSIVGIEVRIIVDTLTSEFRLSVVALRTVLYGLQKRLTEASYKGMRRPIGDLC